MDADGGWSGFETTLEPLEAYMKKVWFCCPTPAIRPQENVPASTVVWV